MKVLHLVPTLNAVGGVETYLLSLFPPLEAEGVIPLVAYGTGNSELAPWSYHVPSLNGLGRRHGARACRALQNIIATANPDVIHVHHINNVDAVQLCVSQRPVVITLHGYQFICPASDLSYDRTGEICTLACSLKCFAITWWKKCMSRNPRHAIALYRRAAWVMRNAARIAAFVSPSKYTAERHILAGLPQDRMTVLPYFCPIAPLETPRQEPSQPTILFMGRLQESKGFQVFIEALGYLTDVRGILVGNLTPDRSRRIMEMARQLRCADRLQCIQWVQRSAVPTLVKQATVLVFPSLWPETLGIIGLEALACGVPVVASDVGGVREWLVDGVTGYLAPPGDARTVASRVKRLLACPAERAAMGCAGIELMKTKFDPGTHVRQLVTLYRACKRMGAG